MPFIKMGLKDAKEAEHVPEGEYDLRIVKAEDKKSKAGNPMTAVTIRIEDPNYPNAQLLNHFLNYPTGDAVADPLRLRDIARFLTLFEVAYQDDGFNSEDLVGQTARGLLTIEDGDNGQKFNRLNPPRLGAEKAEDAGKRRRRA